MLLIHQRQTTDTRWTEVFSHVSQTEKMSSRQLDHKKWRCSYRPISASPVAGHVFMWYYKNRNRWYQKSSQHSNKSPVKLTILGILSISTTLFHLCLSMTCWRPPSDSTACHRLARSVSNPLTYKHQSKSVNTRPTFQIHLCFRQFCTSKCSLHYSRIQCL